MAIFLGIDGGGTKTSCLIGDEQSVLGSGTCAGSNLVRVSESDAGESLAAAIRQACAVANVAPAQITRTCVGMAGAARPQISQVIGRILRELVPGEIQIVGDMVIALEAAFGTGAGVVVIAGTGSIAYGRNSPGQTARAGGWGPAISDEGSGHWIGRSAVAAVMRARDEDEGGRTPLLERIMKAWSVNSHDQIVLAANVPPAPNFSELAPVVLSAADAGDTLATAVLTQAGNELAALADIVIRRLFQNEDATVPVAMSGGVFRNSVLVRQSFYNNLRLHNVSVLFNSTVIEPVRGALEMARRG
jgi:N-acetylglucosamine kinase-like BadF-type ATPase